MKMLAVSPKFLEIPSGVLYNNPKYILVFCLKGLVSKTKRKWDLKTKPLHSFFHELFHITI